MKEYYQQPLYVFSCSNFLIICINLMVYYYYSSKKYPLWIVYKECSITLSGMYYATATLGVAVGYIVGGHCLQLNEEFLSEDKHK